MHYRLVDTASNKRVVLSLALGRGAGPMCCMYCFHCDDIINIAHDVGNRWTMLLLVIMEPHGRNRAFFFLYLVVSSTSKNCPQILRGIVA